MNRRTAVAGACVIGALLSGCSASLNLSEPPADVPHCLQPLIGKPDHLDGPLVLAAQSVPGAALVPCVRRLPAGWTFRDFSAQRGRTRLWLNLGTDNENALEMTFTATCEVGDARRAPSDESGTVRFDTGGVEASAYRGDRFYRFTGGCVAYRFDVHGAGAPQAVRTISRALGFVDRTALRRYVEAYSDGRFHLDPSPGG